MGIIYLIENTYNHKKYIGKTSKNLNVRWKEHIYASTRSNPDSVLHKAINKYGEDAFIVKTLLCNISNDELNHYEKLWIRKLNTKVPYGYNLTDGGDGVCGYHHTDATKSLLSIKNKSKKLHHGDKVRAGILKNDGYRKRSMNHSWRANISNSRHGKYCGTLNGFYGKHHSLQTRKHLSDVRSTAIEMWSLDGNLIAVFKNALEAQYYLISMGKTNNKYANSRILEICHGKGKTAYGFVWKFQKGVETNCKPEDELPVEAQRILKN